MAIFVRGDVHGNFCELTDFIERFNLTEKDTIIVLGDMALYWRKDGKDAQEVLNMYEKYYNTYILWIDGNHENFDLIEQLPQLPGTPFKKCSNHVFYIPRGTIFNLNINGQNKTCLACGGADSVDKFRRTKHLTWWEQETISDEDIDKCINNAKYKHIDYVFTHTCPMSVFREYAIDLITLPGLDQSKVDHSSEEKLERLMNSIDFCRWHFGHYHVNQELDDRFTCLFTDFIELK